MWSDMRAKLICWLIDRYAQLYVLFNPVTPVATGRVNACVYAVKTGQVNFYLYGQNGRYICFDAGLGRHIAVRELERLGIDPGHITHIFLTHTDFDHVGGAGVFPGARIYIAGAEKVMLGRQVSRKFGLLYNNLPGDYTPLEDGETVTAGDIHVKAIHTPGHTPGSMSYLVDGKHLFTGDAFRIVDGAARPNGKLVTMDMEASVRSIRKLAQIPGVETVYTGHRGFWDRYDAVMEAYK